MTRRMSANVGSATAGEVSFHDLANRAVRGMLSPNELSMVTHESVRDRYREELLSMKRDAENQLIERKAALARFKSDCMARGSETKDEYFAVENEYQTWRAGLMRYYNGIERQLAELRTKFGAPESRHGNGVDARLRRIEMQLIAIASALGVSLDEPNEVPS